MQTIFDIPLWIARKKRALETPIPGADFLMKQVVQDLGDRLAAVGRSFNRAATLFCQTPDGSRILLDSKKTIEITRVEADTAFLCSNKGTTGLVAAPETVPFRPESLDLAVSLLSMQAMNDIPGFIVQVRRALKPDGLFLGAMAGAGTLNELRESLLAAENELYGGISPRISPFVDVKDAGALLQRAGLALPVADIETITVRYDNLFALMADLRAMGETNILSDRTRRPGTRTLFARAGEIYAKRFSDPNGRIRASFSIVWLSGWAPDPSQQKPLRPGSAKMSLAKALENPNDF